MVVRLVSLRYRPPLPPGNTPGIHFCYRLIRPEGHSATGRIMSLKNTNDTIGKFRNTVPKVKESRNRPGVAQRVVGGLGSQIS